MNIRFKNHILSVINLHTRKQNWSFFKSVISGNQTFLSQIYRVVVSRLGQKLDFSNPLRFAPKSEFGHETSKLNPNSIRSSEQNMNNKNLIHGRETPSNTKNSYLHPLTSNEKESKNMLWDIYEYILLEL